MKAVVKTHRDPGNVEYIDMPEPTAGPGQVVIEVHNAGVCGTDIHIFKSEYVIDPPVILGHEMCGTIAEVGQGVTRFKQGGPGDGQPVGRQTVRPMSILPDRGAVLLCRPRRPRQHYGWRLCQVLCRAGGSRLPIAGEPRFRGGRTLRTPRLLCSGRVRTHADRAR